MGKFSKRKKNYYLPCKKKLKTDDVSNSIGFLATCNAHANVCMREGHNLLKHYGDQLYGPEVIADEQESPSETSTEEEIKDSNPAGDSNPKEESDDDDLESSLKKEVATLQTEAKTPLKKKLRRFQVMKSSAASHLFFKTSLEDPLPLMTAMMDDIIATKQQKSKHVIRLLPVHVTCKAYLDKIEKQLTSFCSSRFKDQEKTFYIVVNIKSNSSIKKEEILGLILKVMKEEAPKCKAVLTDSDFAIVVNILVTNCFIGEAPHYLTKYKKYNLLEMVTPSDNKPKKPIADQLVLENNQIVLKSSIKQDDKESDDDKDKETMEGVIENNQIILKSSIKQDKGSDDEDEETMEG